MDQFNTTLSQFSPSDFLQWRESQLLNITPKFQRRGVWNTPTRSAFIDTMLRGMPVPPIYLRNIPSDKHPLKTMHEVVDGQQRIKAVLDFMDGEYRLSKSVSPWSGKRFAQLSITEQQKISSFSFITAHFKDISDEDLTEVFRRLNTYSVKLNAQELRNGTFFGVFKETVYKLASAQYKFWREHKIFTDIGIARMLEAELTSELLIAAIAGMQDKKKSIDNFYREYNEEFPNREREEVRFAGTLEAINAACNGELAKSDFNRPPLFYTLYCVVYNHLYGLPDAPRESAKKALSRTEAGSLRDVIVYLSEVLSAARADKEDVPKKYVSFLAASSTQTDNIKPRETRFKFLHDGAFN